MDLIDMSKFIHQNRGFCWIFILLDVFTRRMYCYAMKNKTEHSILNVLEQFLKSYHPDIIISDNEAGFRSKIVQRLLDENEIAHSMVEPQDHKALGIVDRACRTLKNAIYKYMNNENTATYINELPRIVEAYNATPHLGILNIIPNEAEEKDNIKTIQLLNRQKEQKNNDNRIIFNVSDTVRIKLKQNPFAKGYDEKYSQDIYHIERIDGNYAILNDGQRKNFRRLIKVADTGRRNKSDFLAEAKKQSKINKAIAREHLEIDNNEFVKPISDRRLRSMK